MRLTTEQSQKNRQMILTTASKLFRLHGLDDVSVADIMKECGFTHGGFYNHFKSKDDLAVEALGSAFERSSEVLSEKISLASEPYKGLGRLIADYLNESYRDSASGGCPAAALPADAARSGEEIQRTFARGVESYLGALRGGLSGSNKEVREKSITLLAGMVGALTLSRAVKSADPQLSDELLSSARKQLRKQYARAEVHENATLRGR